VDIGRTKTTAVTANAQVGYKFNPATNAGVNYGYTRSDVSGTGGNVTDGHDAGFAITRQLTLIDSLSLEYSFNYITTDFTDDTALGDNSTTTTINTVLLGWTRQLTQTASLTVKAGPSFTGGDVRASGEIQLADQFKVGGTFVNAQALYTRSQGVVVGLGGAQNIDLVSASASFAPAQLWNVTIDGSFGNYSSIEGLSSDFRVYTVGLSVVRTITKWLSASASYNFIYQEQEGGDLTRNVIQVNLNFTYPFRIY
jgi:hypothetical protein